MGNLIATPLWYREGQPAYPAYRQAGGRQGVSPSLEKVVVSTTNIQLKRQRD